MKTILFALISMAAHAEPSMVQNGECGKWKPSWRVMGVSSVSQELAAKDADTLAAKSCKQSCDNNPGAGIVAKCGVHDYLFEEEIHRVTVDYLCTCGF